MSSIVVSPMQKTLDPDPIDPPKILPRFACMMVIMLCFGGSVSGATIDVMSFNIRNATSASSRFLPPNGWYDANDLANGQPLTNGRRLRALAVIRANSPDLLGVQESVAL